MIIVDKFIYEVETIEEFKRNTKKPICSYILNKILNFYIIINDYEGLIKYINNNDKKKYEKITNYYKYLYYEKKKELGKRNEYYNKLTPKQKLIIKIKNAPSGIEQLKIFEEELLPIINNPIKRKKYGYLIKELYMTNASRGDKFSIINSKYQNTLNREIRKILKRKKINIKELSYLDTILEIIRMYFMNNMEKDIVFKKNQIEGIERIIKISEKNVENYKKILPISTITRYYNNICEAIRVLIAITPNKKKLEEYIKKLKIIINENEVSEYLKELLSYEDKTKDELIESSLNNLKNALEHNSNDLKDIETWFHQCISQQETINDFKVLYETIHNIELSKDLSQEIREEVESELKIISFWGNLKEYKEIKIELKARPLLSLILKYEAQKITYNEFLEEVKKLNSLETHSIECWERIESIFKNNNFDWLTIILSKEVTGNITYKLKKYIRDLYTRIRKEEKHLSLEAFEKIERTYTLISRDHTLYLDAILTYIEIYEKFDTYVRNKITIILSSINYTNYKKDSIDYFLYLIVILTVQRKNQIDSEFINNLIKHIEKNDFENKFELLYCLSILDNNLLVKYFDEFVKVTNDYFSNKKRLDEQMMSLLYTVFNYQIKGIDNYPKGTIIHNQDESSTKKIVVREKDYIDLYSKIYEDLNIEKVNEEELNEIDNNKLSNDNILEMLTARVVFANIEEFGFGKKILIPENISGEELIKELEKAIGADEDAKIIKSIRNGVPIENTFWLNHYTTHKYIKDVESNPESLFKNSKNDNILKKKIVIHYTSFILLAKLGIIEKLVDPSEIKNEYYILNDTKKDIYEKKEKNIINYDDYIDGVVDYSETLESAYIVVKALEDLKRIINVPSANTLGVRNLNNINSQDKELFKVIGENPTEYAIVTEDTYYFSNMFASISYGTLSLLINMYKNKLLTEKELLDSCDKLEAMGYNFRVERTLLLYLLSKEELKPLVTKINEVSLKK